MEVSLTPREASVLEYLLRHVGQVRSKREILEQYFNEWDNSVDPIYDEYAY